MSHLVEIDVLNYDDYEDDFDGDLRYRIKRANVFRGEDWFLSVLVLSAVEIKCVD